mgnify:CR=1 FL=1
MPPAQPASQPASPRPTGADWRQSCRPPPPRRINPRLSLPSPASLAARPSFVSVHPCLGLLSLPCWAAPFWARRNAAVASSLPAATSTLHASTAPSSVCTLEGMPPPPPPRTCVPLSPVAVYTSFLLLAVQVLS